MKFISVGLERIKKKYKKRRKPGRIIISALLFILSSFRRDLSRRFNALHYLFSLAVFKVDMRIFLL